MKKNRDYSENSVLHSEIVLEWITGLRTHPTDLRVDVPRHSKCNLPHSESSVSVFVLLRMDVLNVSLLKICPYK